MGSDLWLVAIWWGTLFLFGAVAFPLTRKFFDSWYDAGYLFSKAVGLATVSWLVYVFGTTRIVPFTIVAILGAMGVVLLAGFLIRSPRGPLRLFQIKTILAEEIFFFLSLLFWSWIKGHEPSIRGLEKFMDYGFMKSILNSQFFPPADMWYAGKPINYYYFGHLVTAVLTKFSGLDLSYTFNLMLATLFALTLTMSFAIGRELLRGFGMVREIGGGLLTAFLVTLAGNMQTIYAFTQGYTGDNVAPFWKLLWPIGQFIARLPEGLNRYWYANATRFIPFTIHEFPSYSFVVSDVHGQVLSIPLALLAIAMLIGMVVRDRQSVIRNAFLPITFYGFLVGLLLMTNALDGPIYLGLFAILILINKGKGGWVTTGNALGIVVGSAFVTSLPFLFRFESFVSGIAVNCPPAFLQNLRFGPILFESVQKCQRSPLWMLALLWGFFWYCGTWFFFRKKSHAERKYEQKDRVLKVFFLFSLALIIFPEFFYFKDIYPQHFRANTMFKLGYQAFIMFSIVSGYTIVKMISEKREAIGKKIFFVFLLPQLFLVSIYPIFSIRSYFNSLSRYEGLWGLNWFAKDYRDDYLAMLWLGNQPRTGGTFSLVEADGESYTDYARFSAFTGIPAIIGWPVHEWLWRGSYDVVAPRREVVRIIYESKDPDAVRGLLSRFDVRYIIIGSLERQKYPGLIEEKFTVLGRVVFRQGNTTIYQVL